MYKQELALAGMEDGDANLDIPERRRLLKDHQDAWENMEFTGDRIIDDLRSPFLRSYELQAGVLSQQTARRSLTFTQIPSEARGIPFASRSLDIDVNIADHTFDLSQNLLVIVEDLDMNALYACNHRRRDLLLTKLSTVRPTMFI